ncbi:MAG: sodium:solute symporter family protein, partial [Planctomycetota bacterium JB042]
AFTAKDDRTIRRTVVLYPTFQLFLLPLLIIGFSGVLFEVAPARPDQIVPHLLVNLDLSPFLVGLFCAGALAASMSSGDAMAHAAASIAVRDGLVTSGGLRPTPSGERNLIRVVVVLVMVASYALAIAYEGSLVGLLLLAYGPVTQFAPAVVATLCWRRATGPGVLAGLLAGAAVNLVLSAPVRPDWKPWPLHEGLYGLVLNAIVLVAVSRATAPRDDRAWFEVAGNGR